MFKAAIRVNKITTIAQLRGATLHAERHDITGQSRVRDGAEPGFGLAWSKDANDRDYLAAFRAHKKELKAGERKGAPIALQALCVVSPEWVEKAGDLHDPDNPHNRQLFDQAKAWAESWAGEGSVFGSRLDLDEKGGAVVDLMIAPVRASRGKPVISTNKALGEVKTLTGERNEYAALQTSWADWCRDTLDPEIVRGTRKEITRRQHLSPETYGAVMDKARESLSEGPQAVMELVKATELPEDLTQALSDVLTLKVEINRHKAHGHNYEPPEGGQRLDAVYENQTNNPWIVINTVRHGAQRIYDAASRLGLSIRSYAGDSYEAGRDLFPSLPDRMHLAGVLAKCGEFMARTEQLVKNLMNPEGHQIDIKGLWPQEAYGEVERHDINLGLAIPQQERSVEIKPDVSIAKDTGYSI